jgi:drug/metabolite transporter (DMT)-like permease
MMTARAYAILFAAQLAIGSAAIFARYALEGARPIAISALRLSIAGFPLLIYSLWKNPRSLPRRHELLLACAGISLAVHFATWIASLQYTSVAVSTLLVSTSPLWTGLYDVVVAKQRKPLAFWLSLLGGAVGVLLIIMDKSAPAPIQGFAYLGSALAAIGALAFAAYLIAIRSISSTYSTLTIVGRTYAWAAIALIAAALGCGEGPPGNNPTSWFGIIAMAFFSQALGHTGLNASLQWFSSSTVAFSTLLEPVFAAIIAAALFGERLAVSSLIGCVIVLVSLFVVLRYGKSDDAGGNTQAASPTSAL